MESASPASLALRGRGARLAREAPVLAAVALFVLATARFSPLELNQDSWLALVCGRLVAENGLPSHEVLTIFAHGARWVDQQWLGQLALYELVARGGLHAALALDLLLVGGAIAIAVTAARRAQATPLATCVVATASLFCAPWIVQLRTQSLALPLFAAVLALLCADSRRPSARVLAVLPLLVLWANLHGSVLIGIGLCLLRALTRLWPAGRRSPDTVSLVLILAAPLCALASPYGTALVGYYRLMLVNPPFAHIVAEWQPTSMTAAPLFVVLALAALWLLGRTRSRLTAFEKLALAATILAGFIALRSVVWFALAAALILPPALDGVLPRGRDAGAGAGRGYAVLAAAALAALLLAPALLLRRPEASFVASYPASAARSVALQTRRDPALRVFASDRYADWLLWQEPSLSGRVAADARFELLSRRQVGALSDLRNGVGAGWARATRPYGLFLLDRRQDARLVRRLRRGGARVVYRAPGLIVLRRDAAPA